MTVEEILQKIGELDHVIGFQLMREPAQMDGSPAHWAWYARVSDPLGNTSPLSGHLEHDSDPGLDSFLRVALCVLEPSDEFLARQGMRRDEIMRTLGLVEEENDG